MRIHHFTTLNQSNACGMEDALTLDKSTTEPTLVDSGCAATLS